MIDRVAGNNGQKTTDVGKLFVKCVKNQENMSTGLLELFAVIVMRFLTTDLSVVLTYLRQWKSNSDISIVGT